MVKLTDEVLMAYVDGELDEVRAEEIRKAVDTDTDARHRLEKFKESAAMLQGVYDAPLQEAVPSRLINTVMNFKTEKAIPAPGPIERFLSFLGISPDWKPAYALVASLALLVGAGTVHLAHTLISPDQTRTAQQQTAMTLNGEAFNRGMDTAISGQPFRVDDQGLQITPVATFIGQSNRYCRQYEAVQGQDNNRPAAQGIACRNDAGKWSTLIAIHPSADSIAGGSGSNFIPAGEEDLAEMVFPQIMASPPMSLQKESELIKQSWAAAP